MVFHGLADNVGDLMKGTIVFFKQSPQNTALDGLESIVYIGNRAVLDDIGRIFYEILVHHCTQARIGTGLNGCRLHAFGIVFVFLRSLNAFRLRLDMLRRFLCNFPVFHFRRDGFLRLCLLRIFSAFGSHDDYTRLLTMCSQRSGLLSPI